MQVAITPFGLEAIQRGFAQAPDMAREELLAAMEQVTLLVHSDVQGNFPHVHGTTRNSITSDAYATPAGVLGVVGSPSPVAGYIEFGTRPHFPPIEPLIDWVRSKLGLAGDEGEGVARAIQRKIGRVGTLANPQFEPALARQRAFISREFDYAARRIAARLENPEGQP